LSGIAKRFAVTLRNLLGANPQITDPGLIHVGDAISIPAAYLPTLGGEGSTPQDINNRGQIVGSSGTPSGTAHAVIVAGEWITDLGTLGGEWSSAEAVNDIGQVVGWSDTSGDSRRFLWEAGSMIGIEGNDAGPWDINDRGQIVTGQDFIWQDGVKTHLGSLGGNATFASAINDVGQVVGHSHLVADCPPGGCGWHAFLWQDGTMTDLGTLGGYVSEAFDVNNRGQVVGESPTVRARNGEIPFHAFLWEDGVMTDLGTLGGRWSTAAAVNDRGQVVGSSLTRSGEEHAFLWQDGVMTDLGTLRGKNGATGAFAINDLGQVLGYSNGHSFMWQDGVMTDLGPLGPSRGCG
jgi:probable HAF family extracellular repeat protein